MKKELLSIVKFFLSAFFTSSISFPLYGEAGVVKNLADSGKTAYSGFASAPFKKIGSGNKYSSAIFGNALSFDGVDDYVTMGAGLTLPHTGWTEEMWIFVPSLPPAVQFMDLISGDDMGVSSKRGPFLMIFGNNSLHGGYGYGTENTQRSYEARNVLTVNAWNHIAQTYNGSRLKAYVNGIQVIDVAAPERPNANPIKYLGRGLDNDYNYYFKEAMDEVRIWNRARTAEEIRDNYANTVPSNHPDLLLYYSFNQGMAGGDNRSISAVTDNTGRNNGSVNNFALNGTSSNYVSSLVLLGAPVVEAASSVTDDSFTVRWRAPSGRITNYILEIATSADFTKKASGHHAYITVPHTQTSFTVSGLSPDVTYYCRVRAATAGIVGIASNIISVKTRALSGFGNALSFDGERQGDGNYVTMGAGLTLPHTGWTEEMWIYVPTLSADIRKRGMMVIGDVDIPVWSKRGPFFMVYDNTILHGGYGAGDNQIAYDAPNVLTVNAWNHIAQTYNGSRLKAYVNGVQVADVAAPERPNANPIKYLGRGLSEYYYDFKGSMDEVRIWNYARSAEEIRDNYKTTVSPSSTGLIAYYDFNQGIAGGDNRAIKTLIDNKGSYAILNNFAKTGATSNFVGTLKLVPPTAIPASEVTFSSFTARWAGGKGSSPTANTYFIDVSTDETFADESKYVTGYRNKEVGNVAELTVTGLNPSTAYYYRVRAGYLAPWLHPGDNSNTIKVNTGVLPAITAVDATNITEGSFMAGWQAPSSGRVTNYILEIATSADFTKKVPRYETITVPSAQTSFTVSGLNHGVTYYYRVKAVSGGATGTAGNIISVKTAAISGFGNALNFDGADDYVIMGEELTLPQTGWTEEMWIYLPTVSWEVGKVGMTVIGGDEMNIFSKRGPFLMIYGNTSLHGGYGYGTGYTQKTYDARNVLTVNAWNHIAQTYDGSRLKAYVNGIQVANVAAPQRPSANSIKYLGRGLAGYYYDFKGAMDEVRIWSRARTAEEIRDNYTNTVPSNHPDLLLYYSFNQGTAGGDNRSISAVTDNTGRNNGVFHGFALNGTSSNYVSSVVLLDAPVVEAASSVTEGSFTVSWQAPSGTINNYILEIATSADFTKKASGHHAYITVPATQTTFTVSGLSPDVTYYCRVRAAAAGIVGIASNIIPVKTAAITGFGNALSFDGDIDYVAMGAGLTLPHTGWTEEMWIYLPTVSWEVEKMGMTVIGGDELNNFSKNNFSKRAPFLMIYGNTSLHGGYGYGTGYIQKTYDARNVLTVNAWNHIAQTYNGSRLKAYVNGVQVADVEATERPNANLVKYLGRGLSGYYYDFKGSMDEVRIWNYARSAEEIRDNYKTTVSPSSTGLIAYYDFNQGIAGGDNRAIKTLIDNKGSYAILNNFAKTGAESNFVGTLKLVPPTATPASEVTFSSFTARWVGGEGSSPTANTYFIDVSTDETFADESKYVTGYRNKEVGNVAELTVTGLNPSTAYYYRVRAGYSAPWLHPGDNSNTITVNTGVLPAITAVDATNITEGSFTAGWQALSSVRITNYILEIATSADFTKKASGHHAYITVPATQTTFTVSGLSPDVTYYCRVRAAVAGIVGIASNIIPVKTAALSGLGNALSFDGADDFVALGTGFTLPQTGWTEEMWVYVPTVSADVSKNGMIVISNDEMNNFSKRAPFLMIYDDTSLWGGYGYGTGNTQKTYDARNVLTVNAWNHIAQTYNGSRLKAYVNGVQVADVVALERPNANPIKYLGRAVVEYHYYFKGSMDEVRIWNYARSEDEIRDNYKTTVSPSSTGLIAYYDFNQGIAGEDNRAIKTLIDNKGSYAILNNFAKTGATSNFVGTLKLVPPTATPASEVTFNSFTARWAGGEGSSPTANTYFIDVSTDETFADESKYVAGYRNKEVGNVAELTVTGLNPSTAYYYRVRAGYSAPWLHRSDNSNAITVNTGVLPAITAVDATNITEGSFTAGWQALSSGRVTNYILEIATSADFTKKVLRYETITVPATQTTFTVSGLSPGVTYYYRVRAAPSGAFFGIASNIIPVKTAAITGFGNALSFDGADDFVALGTGFTLPQTGWTEEMWVYVPTVSADVSKNGMIVISNDEMNNFSKRAPFLMIYDDTSLYGGYGYGTGNTQKTYDARNVLTVNAWNHIAQTYNGSRLKAYVNGVQVADVVALERPNANPIKYLGRAVVEYHYYFKGAMDEVRIWNYARSADEIRDNYTKTVSPSSTGLIAYYDFNQGIAGGDNRAIKTLIDNKGSYAILNNFAKTGATSNFVGTLKLVPPTATPASEVTFNSFTARWAGGEGSSPTANTYFIDVSTDETFADESKYVAGYRNKEVGNVAELTLTGLNPSTAYYYRVRAGYSAPWLHPNVNSNTIKVNTGVLPAITAVDATNITEGSFMAGWQAPSSGRVTNYILEIATSADFTKKAPGQAYITVPATQTSFTVSGLNHGVTYYYRVKAVSGGATGTAGNIIPVKTAAITGFGNALSFDGDRDYVAMGEELTLPQTGWTEEMWVYVPTLSAAALKEEMMIIGGGDEMSIYSKRAPFLMIYDNTSLWGGYGYGTRNNLTYTAPNVLTVNAWNHIAQTYNGSRLKAYVNGVQVADVAATKLPNANPIKYLGRGHGEYFYDFKGMMDEVRIWSRARTAEEIRDNYANTVPSNHPDLLLYYSFNQGMAGGDNRSISAVTDNTGRNNGVFHGFALNGPSSNYVSSLVLLDAPVVEAASSVTEDSFTVRWRAPSGRITNYILEIATSADFTKKASGHHAYITVPATQTTFTVSGLSPDVTYYCRVRAAVAGIVGIASNIIPVKTTALSGLGNALSFDGADDFVALGTGFTLPQTGWTEEMWVYVPTVSADVSKNGMIVISNDEMNNFSKRAPFLMIYDDTSLYGGYGYGTGNTQKTYDARNVLTVNAWNHIAQTYNGSRLKAYVNGVQVADVETMERPNANPIKYLGRAVVEYHYYFKGAMDEVRIWNYARSAEEIRDNYKTTVSPSSTGLIAYYDFNQGIAGEDNRAIEALIDNKGSYAILNNFAKTGAESNFIGTLKLVPPTATPASEVTFNSFTARWAGGEGSSPTANTYFIDVSTDETFADESKYVTGYRNKEVGNVAELTVTGLNPSTAYYYRVRAGYSAPWLHRSDNSNAITVNTGVLPAITAVDATNITEGSFTAGWQEPSSGMVTNYILEIAASADFTKKVPRYETITVPATQTSFMVSGLSPDVTYYYRVKAVSGEFVGTAGNIIPVTTTALSGFGNALSFDGENDYLTMGAGLTLPQTGWTEEMWVYVPVLPSNTHINLISGDDMHIFSKRGPFFQIYNDADNIAILQGGYGYGTRDNQRTYEARNVLTVNAWNHIAQTYNGSRLKAYVNGIQVADVEASELPNANPIKYLGRGLAGYYYDFKGAMDEVRIWNRARTAEEIRDNYTKTVSPNDADLLAYYDFNQGIAGGNNRAIEALINNKGSYAIFNNFAKTDAKSNFVGTLKLVPPAAAPAIDITGNSFTVRWAEGEGSSPTANTYFIDVSTDETFADESKYVTGYRNKELGNVAKITVTGLNPSTAYYYRVRAGYSAPWLHPSDNSNTITVNTGVLPAITAVDATNITEGSFTAGWQAAPVSTIDNYILEIATSADFTKKVLRYETITVPATQTTFTVSGLSPGITYYYRVKAVLSGVTGTAGNIIPVKTTALSGFGNALNFTGNEGLTISNGGLSFPVNGWTQEMWIYVISAASAEHDYASLLSNSHSKPVYMGPSMYVYDKTKLHGGYGDGKERKQYTTRPALQLDAWNHVAQTFDGSDLKVYVNGVLVESFHLPGTSNTYKIDYIGHSGENDVFGKFQGNIDEVRIWNRARSAEEIKENYAKKIDSNDPDLLVYYNFNQGIAGGDNRAIEVLVDRKGGYNGRFENFAKSGSKSNFVGSLKLAPPLAASASVITGDSFTARWAMGEGSSPTANKYFIDVSTDETFADERKYVSGYRNKELGKVTEHIVKGLNMANGVYYYRLRAGYSAPWLHQSVNSNVIAINGDVFPAAKAVEATNITEGSFTASWQPPLGKIADGYILKVARDASFTSLVPGYENLRVPKTQTQVEVKGLSPDFTWYYQVKAVFRGAVGIASNVVSVKTAALSGLGNALAFDGENDYVDLGEISFPSNEWTEELWFYLPKISADRVMELIGCADMAAPHKRAPFIQIVNEQDLQGGYGDGKELKTYYVRNALTVGVWNHLAQTFDGRRIKAYVNGNLVADVSAPVVSGSVSSKVYLSNYGDNFKTVVQGIVDEVRIWGRARSAEEISDYYKITVDKNDPDLLAYYDFNQGVTGGDNRAIKVLIDHKGAYNGEFKNFSKTGFRSNFVGGLKLVAPSARPAIDITGDSFTARWAMGVGSSPTANKYFIDVSTDETFADESKYVPGYRNKELGDVTSHTVTGLNTSKEVYYYRLRAGHSSSWLHPSVSSGVVAVSFVPLVKVLEASNITEGSFMANWEELGSSQVNGYFLEVSRDADFTDLVSGYENVESPSGQSSWEVVGLNPAYTYYYRVKAVMDGVVGTTGNHISVRTADLSGLGNALNFSGKEKVVFSNGGISFPANRWSQEMWIYASSFSDNQYIFKDEHTGFLDGPCTCLSISDGRILTSFNLVSGVLDVHYAKKDAFIVGAWNHIARTYDGVDLKIYVNGVLVESFNLPSASKAGNMIRLQLQNGSPLFQGSIDEVRIWNYARSAEEIRDNYKTSVSSSSEGLIAYYDFNQGVSGGDNRGVGVLIDRKGAYDSAFEDFAKTGSRSNFVGTLKLVPPAAAPAIDITGNSFTACWAMGEESIPVSNKYFIDVSTDKTFADESKYVPGYRNKELGGDVTSHTVRGLNTLNEVYYYRLRAGYEGEWLHPSVSSGVITVSFVPSVKVFEAANVTEGSFRARWEELDDPQVTGYVLEVSRDAGFTNLVFGYENLSLPVGSTSCEVTGLNPAYTYYYRVKAVSGESAGTTGNIIPVKTTALNGLGNALSFTGKEKVVFSNGGISFPAHWSHEMWVYASFFSDNQYNFKDDHKNHFEGLCTCLSTSDGLRLTSSNMASESLIGYLTSKNLFTVGAWNHIAQVYDGDKLQVYVNGVFAESFDFLGSPDFRQLTYMELTDDSPLFQGSIDEVRIWNYARSAEEIKNNYKAPVSAASAGLIAYYDFNQGIAGGDNRAIEALIDNKGGYNGQLEDFAKTETRSNFVGTLKLVPPAAAPAIDIRGDSFTARWAMGEGSTPTANTYFIDVSTDETFADESKYVAGYRNKELGNVTSHTVKGLNMPSESYYYRLRAGYGGSWLHSSVSSGVVSVSSSLQSNTILLASMDEKVYGSSPYQLSVSSSGTGSYAYTLISGDAVSISSTGLVSVLKAGTATISVTQSSDGVYASGGPVIQVITVHPKQLTIAVHAIDKEYDGSTKAFVNLSVIGRIDHDDVTASAEETVFDNKNVGRDKPVYIRAVVLSGSESANYALSAIPSVSASITPRTLIVQAENKTRSPGEGNPLLTVVYKGFIEGDNENNALLSPPLITTKADKSSPSGDYPIEANGAVSLHDNYQIIYHSGVLTVTPVSVTSFTFKASLLYSDSPGGSFAGSFSAESALPSTYAYTLVSGAVDNDKFVLEGENLYVNSKFNYKSDVVFTIRVLVSTQWGFSVIKDFPVNVLHKNKAPTLDRIPDQSVCATSASHSINLSGLSSGGETEQSLSLSISSDRVEMFHTLNVSFLSDGQGVINYSLNSGVSGSAFVTVTVTDNGGTANGGVDAYAVSFRVTSNPLPSIIISSNTGKFKVIRGGSLELTASSPGSISYLWSATKGVLGSRNGSRLLVQPLENTVYTVGVTTEGGCVEFEQVVVEVEDESMDEVVVNNILTPNGDGVNDLWVVQHIERYPNAVVKVFDRGRRLVFIQKSYDNKWDGSFKGRPLRGGTYYYAIDFEGTKKETKKGYISIIY